VRSRCAESFESAPIDAPKPQFVAPKSTKAIRPLAKTADRSPHWAATAAASKPLKLGGKVSGTNTASAIVAQLGAHRPSTFIWLIFYLILICDWVQRRKQPAETDGTLMRPERMTSGMFRRGRRPKRLVLLTLKHHHQRTTGVRLMNR
jgi:hypothetical protein